MPRSKRYTIEELMAECDSERPRSAEEQAWLDLVPVGLEFGASEGSDGADESNAHGPADCSSKPREE